MTKEELVNSYLQEHKHDVLLSPYSALLDFVNIVTDWHKKENGIGYDSRDIYESYEQGRTAGKAEVTPN